MQNPFSDSEIWICIFHKKKDLYFPQKKKDPKEPDQSPGDQKARRLWVADCVSAY